MGVRLRVESGGPASGGPDARPALRALVDRASRGLDVATRAGARIVAELEADVEGLYRHYVGRGLDPGAALRAVEERLGVSAAALSELRQLHAPLHLRLLRRFEAGAGHAVERGLLLVLLPMLILMGLVPVMAQGMVDPTRPMSWPVLVCAAGVVIVGLRLIRGPAPFASRTLGLLAIAAPLLGLTIAVVDLYFTAGVGGAGGGSTSTTLLFGWLGRAAGLLSSGLLVSLAAGLLWFLRRSRMATYASNDKEA